MSDIQSLIGITPNEYADLEQDKRRLEWLVNEVREYNRPILLLLLAGNWRDAIDAAMQEEGND